MAEIFIFPGQNNALDGHMSEVQELSHLIFADGDKIRLKIA